MSSVYEEIIDFISAGPTSSGVASWQPSDQAKAEVERLVNAAKEGTLSSDERVELNHYLELEHVMRMAKAKARARLANE
jgi:hypothetical protein